MSTATAVYWPTMSDYQMAVQSPSFCFRDAELKSGTAVTNKLGLPRPICGQFASVYEIATGKRRYAAKCFLRNIPDQHDRYARISEHLNSQKTAYFVTFEYQKEGILIQGEFYPLVKMEWIEGLALNVFMERNLTEPKALLDLESRWLTLLDDLKAVDIAHGDLQHGNVIVEDGSLRLIDYDGMWVPALEGQRSHETGHPDFQSPLRTAKDFHGDIDRFSGAVVQIAIRALSKKPQLWEKFNNDDNLLFKRQDYLDPSKSQLISELKRLGDDVIDAQLRVVIEGCAARPHRAKGKEVTRPGTARVKKARGGKRKDAGENTGEKAKTPPPKTGGSEVREEKMPARRQRSGSEVRDQKSEVRSQKSEVRTPNKAAKGGQPAATTQARKPPAPRRRQAASPRDQKKAATAAPAASQKSSPSWLGDHVASHTRPGAPPASPSAPSQAAAPASPSAPSQAASPTSPSAPSQAAAPPGVPRSRVKLFLRFAIHAFVLAPVAFPPVAEWMGFLSIESDSLVSGYKIALQTATVLGLLSLGTVLVFRKHHRRVSALFFGFMVLLSAFDIAS